MVIGKKFLLVHGLLKIITHVESSAIYNSKIFGKHPTPLVRGLLLENLRYISSEISKVGFSVARARPSREDGLVTIASIPWTAPECWRSQSDCSICQSLR